MNNTNFYEKYKLLLLLTKKKKSLLRIKGITPILSLSLSLLTLRRRQN